MQKDERPGVCLRRIRLKIKIKNKKLCGGASVDRLKQNSFLSLTPLSIYVFFTRDRNKAMGWQRKKKEDI